MTTRCHSVRSLRSPVVLSRQESVVATLRLAIGRPSWVRRISGSAPRLPTRMTLLTLPAMTALRTFPVCTISVCKFRFAKLPFQGKHPAPKPVSGRAPGGRVRRLTHSQAGGRYPLQKFSICSYQTPALPASLLASTRTYKALNTIKEFQSGGGGLGCD